MKAMIMTGTGGPDVIQMADRQLPPLAAGQVLVEVSAAGVNFMDIGVRRGLAWTDVPDPKVLGVEGAGRVIEVAEDVTDLNEGDRVAWAYAPGSYSEQVIIPADMLVPVPDGIDDFTAASIMMQGLTASHFATDFYQVQPGDFALVHAAAGGLGLLLTQIIKLHGGQVIGRVSRAEKAPLVKEAGADHVIIDQDGDFAREVLELTNGMGVHVVYDGSGPKTFEGSIASLRTSGTFCWYGPVLGGPGPIDIMSLPKSIKIGYAVFSDHIPTPQRLRENAARLFQWIKAGDIYVTIGATYPLSEAARAHADMEARITMGKLLLLPPASS
ncbi:quinone oxidoreductase family protein [Hyphomonas oceanitis]|uniref:Alcohol dehydrogenase n=1 Tax=Hyphomonas oceanitis SCH89 TaxID=1280953 RepID=A0A059G980_9PROT|nr:quinone oxidoreductase [Hyphomonas oceanitis]KDA03150.1 alcohol dehydrogenase [Hyphomonas oceanitis SCH89]